MGSKGGGEVWFEGVGGRRGWKGEGVFKGCKGREGAGGEV